MKIIIKLLFLLVLLIFIFEMTFACYAINKYIEKETSIKVTTHYLNNEAQAIAFIAINNFYHIDYKKSLSVLYVESEGYQYAFSKKGAMGFMQLMLLTAKEQGNKHNIPINFKWDVYDSSNNFYIGIGLLCDEYDFNKSLQFYNVGTFSYKKGIRNHFYVTNVNKQLSLIEKEHKNTKKEVIKFIYNNFISNIGVLNGKKS